MLCGLANLEFSTELRLLVMPNSQEVGFLTAYTLCTVTPQTGGLFPDLRIEILQPTRILHKCLSFTAVVYLRFCRCVGPI